VCRLWRSIATAEVLATKWLQLVEREKRYCQSDGWAGEWRWPLPSWRGTALAGHGGNAVTAVACLTDGRLASGSGDDGTIIVWSSEGVPLRTIGPQARNPDSFDPVTEEEEKKKKKKTPIRFKKFLVAGEDNSLTVVMNDTDAEDNPWRCESVWSWDAVGEKVKHGDVVGSVTAIAVAGAVAQQCDHEVTAVAYEGVNYRINTWNDGGHGTTEHRGVVYAVAVDGRGMLFLGGGGGENGTIWTYFNSRWDRERRPKYELEDVFEVAHGGSVNALVIDPSSCNLISGGDDHLVKVWVIGDDCSLTLRCILPGLPDAVLTVAVGYVGPNGTVVAGAYDGTLSVWTNGCATLTTSQRGEDPIDNLAMCPDGTICTVSRGSSVIIVT
jgi:WD40 repeat protein